MSTWTSNRQIAQHVLSTPPTSSSHLIHLPHRMQPNDAPNPATRGERSQEMRGVLLSHRRDVHV